MKKKSIILLTRSIIDACPNGKRKKEKGGTGHEENLYLIKATDTSEPTSTETTKPWTGTMVAMEIKKGRGGHNSKVC